MSSNLQKLSDEELEANKRRALAGLRAIFIEEWRRELARQGRIQPEQAIPEKGAASSPK